jgi:hypothetical protein
MGARIGGVLNITVDGRQYPIRGSVEVSPSSVKREGIAGQDYVHGFTEMPVVPSIKANVSTTADVSLETLQNITDATIQATLANGKSYVLSQAWTVAAFAIDTAAGQVSVEFQGVTCDEI